jgi:hypothetical protein
MKKITLLALFLSLNSFATIIVRDIPDYTFSTTNNNLPFDFNSDGTNEFIFQFYDYVGSVFIPANVNFVGTGTLASQHGWDVMKSLPINTVVGSLSLFPALGDSYINPFWSYTNEKFPMGDSYIGTTFKIGTSKYYGWILVSSTGGAAGIITVKSYAYNNVADQSINTGQTTLGIDGFSLIKYNIFPNPVNDIFTINSYLNTTEFKVSIIDINGKIINLTSSNDLFNISQLNAGIYFIRIEDNQGNSEIKKVVKN